MKHKNYTRIHTKTGEIFEGEFISIDGKFLGYAEIPQDQFDGFPTNAALLIVNRWNYISTIQPNTRTDYFYYLHTVEGAN